MDPWAIATGQPLVWTGSSDRFSRKESNHSVIPQAELLGIKQLVEQGKLQSKNYVDLIPGSYPPMVQEGTSPEECRAIEQQVGSEMQSEGGRPSHQESPEAAPPMVVEAR